MGWLGDHWVDLLGWCGSTLLIVSLVQTRVLRLRLLNLCASSILIVFNSLVHVWPMVAMNIATATINIFFIRRLLTQRQTFHVLEVQPRDAYLQHFLTVHTNDLRRFFPAFEGTETDDLAFQVQTGDETVGCVLIRPEGDVARVLLDYVTPRYRDFSPGEFVWRSNPVLKQRGFSRVVTPPDMVAPYYERLGLGFRREGRSYVLEL
jgi:hypothetical protein